MKSISWGFLGLSLLVLVVLGCGGLKNILPKKGQYFESDTAQKAAAAIREKVGKPFKVIEIFIDDNEFRVQAVNPDNPKNVDEYKYAAGFVTGPSAVKLSGLYDNPDKSSFPFDDIDFAAIPNFTKEAIDRAGLEGGKIYRLTFQRGFALTESDAGALGNARWHIEIKGDREDVTAAADPKGQLLGVDLSRTSKAKDYTVFTASELQKAQTAFKNHLADRLVDRIGFYDKSVSCSFPNAENPSVGDSVKYDINGLTRGGLTGLNVSRTKSSLEKEFSINDVDLTKAVTFLEKARARVEMPDATLTFMSIENSAISVMDRSNFRIEWRVSLKKGVTEASITYDNDGNELLVRKNGKTIFEEDKFKKK